MCQFLERIPSLHHTVPVPTAHPLFTSYVSSLLIAPRRLQPTILGHVLKQIRK